MTAVARLSVNSLPLLVGDLLLSNEETPQQQAIHVPTIGPHTRAFPAGSGFTISGLRQKLAIVGGNLALGWAGHRIAAQTVIKEIVEENHRNPFTISTLCSYLDDLSNLVPQHFGLVGWLREGETVQGFGFRSTIEFQSVKFGKVGLLGFGAEDFRDYLTAYPDLPDWEVAHPWQSFSTGLLFTGFMLRAEMKNMSSLRQYYGAGYEIVGMDQGSFRKLDNINFAFWEASLNGKKVTFTLLPRILKYSYQGDVLVIRSLIMSGVVEETSTLVANDRVDAIAPIYRNITDQDVITPPQMTSEVSCNYFLIKLPNGISQVFSRVHHLSDAREPLLGFEEGGEEIGVKLNAPQLSEISNEIGQHIDNVISGRTVVRAVETVVS